MATKRLDILNAAIARLARIQTANGFATDAGLKIFLGEAVQLAEGDPNEALALIPGDAVPGDQDVLTSWSLRIAALAKVDLDQPVLAIEAILGDVKRAFERDADGTPERTLGGLIKGLAARSSQRVLPRDEGATTAGVSVGYTFQFYEPWGQP